MQYSTDAPTLGANDRRLDHRGERRLMLAVLEDALRTICGARSGRTNPTWVRQELEWLCSDDTSHPFTYARICEALQIDASWLRRRTLDARGTAMPSWRSMVERAASDIGWRRASSAATRAACDGSPD